MTQPKLNLPARRQWLCDGFDWFIQGYLRKHFHSVAIGRDGLRQCEFHQPCAVVVFGNHCSWWDPLVAILLRKLAFPNLKLYAPIDEDSLDKYRIFGQLGFYGVKPGTAKGAAKFLRQSLAILDTPGSSIWMTPEGRFCDVRDRSNRLMPGLGHLAHRVQVSRIASPGSHAVFFVPLAIELTYWEERLPECLLRFGTPIELEFQPNDLTDKASWSERLELALRRAQDELAADSISRDSSRFEILLKGRAGSWGVYDALRGLRGWLQGKPVRFEHGDKLSGC